MKLVKLFDSIDDTFPMDVRDAASAIAAQIHGNGNDAYFSLEVLERDATDDEWRSYPDIDFTLLNNWLLDHGAEAGENILIYHWW